MGEERRPCMVAYYNEIDPYAAAWLRNLIAADLIAPGDVDERSVVDVRPDELRGYRQCHFFAGIGVWSYALRLAGWPDDREVWTGSCPCQPFSAAGKRAGFADERHLWPAWAALIAERRPGAIFGEQVAGRDGFTWLDAVRADLETCAYAVGAVVLPAASVGAPHGRHRIFFVADAASDRARGAGATLTGSDGTNDRIPRADGGTGELADAQRRTAERYGLYVADEAGGAESAAQERQRLRPDAGHGGESGELGDTDEQRREGERLHVRARGSQQDRVETARRGEAGELADTDGRESSDGGVQRGGKHGQQPQDGGPCNGFWGAAEWLYCTDGKWRPVEPGTFPLATGAPARVGRLRAYGNAINAEAAAAFIRAYAERAGVSA
jgi:DNA (cytosine-5)-methyltransferase 1